MSATLSPFLLSFPFFFFDFLSRFLSCVTEARGSFVSRLTRELEVFFHSCWLLSLFLASRLNCIDFSQIQLTAQRAWTVVSTHVLSLR